MRVLIVGFTKIKYMPYLNIYLENILNLPIFITLLYWDRDKKEDIKLDSKIKLVSFKLCQNDEIPKLFKLKNFVKFKKFATQYILENNYDKVIVLSTIPCVLLKNVLKKKYRNNYIFDYRDYTFEKSKIYTKWVNEVVDNSYRTFISSKGFMKFLKPNKKILPIHNINIDEKKIIPKNSDEKIRIGYWGLIRHYDANIRLINFFGNDTRFEINYYGRKEKTAFELEKYCIDNKITNVRFLDEYEPDQRYIFFSNTDYIHNYYENDLQTTPTMGNKFYDGIGAKIPQICNYGSYMGNEIEKYGLGLTFPHIKFKDLILNFRIEHSDFEKNCQTYIKSVLDENNECKKEILKYINKKEK